ncbi:excalibur calcium-binding domain-containing protein [Lysinibacillus sp. NPDC093712]|uniref:excalibur calcium-binding domain-containing protein n=1 Tax=Lysinibacillus sp. NPDC093712 TaxID=3390579 RepID=UPI003D06D091
MFIVKGDVCYKENKCNVGYFMRSFKFLFLNEEKVYALNQTLEDFDDGGIKYTVKISKSGAIVKEFPSVSSKTIGNIKGGEFVISNHMAEDGWMPIIYNGQYGFVDVSQIEFDLPYKISIVSSKSGVVVKEKATVDSNTVGTLSNGIIMDNYGEVGNGYSYVRYGNTIGYVKTSFLTNPKPVVKYISSSTEYIESYLIASKVFGSAGLIQNGTKVYLYGSVAGWSYIDEYPDDGEVRGIYVESKYLVDKIESNTNLQNKKTNSSNSGSYKNCTELKKDFPNGVKKGHWAYERKHDRDSDGWACEPSWK